MVTTATKTCDHVISIAVIPNGSRRFVCGKTLSMVRWYAPPKTSPTFWST